MKNFLTNLKHKIIHKLGGYTYDSLATDNVFIQEFQYKYVDLGVDQKLYYPEALRMSDDFKKQVMKEMVHRLVEKMYEEDLITFITSEGFEEDILKIHASVTVRDHRISLD